MLPPAPRSPLFPYTTLFRSSELVELGRRTGFESIGVAAHPAGHPRSPDLVSDRDRLASRSEEHTSELQSHHDLVCRLLLEKKKPVAFLACAANRSRCSVRSA